MKKQDPQSHHKIVYLCIMIVMALIIAILIVFIIFLLRLNIEQNESFMKSYYNFDQYRKSNLVLSYQERKENYIKKALYIFKIKEAKFEEEDQIKISSLAFELSEETGMSPILFLAMGFGESEFNNEAIGGHGEKSFLQFMRQTWKGLTGYDNHEGCDDLLLVTRMWFRMMQQNKRELEKQTHKNLNERLLLAYNCNSEMIIKHVIDRDDIKSIKQAVYIRKEKEYYPDKIMKIYNEFNNLKVE
jgi:hypothetical protein